MNWYLSDQCETVSYFIAIRVHPNNDSSNNNWKIVSFTTYSMYKTIHNANALLYGWWMIQSCIDKGGYNCRVRQQRKDYIDIVNIRVVLIINNFIAYSKQCKKFLKMQIVWENSKFRLILHIHGSCKNMTLVNKICNKPRGSKRAFWLCVAVRVWTFLLLSWPYSCV